MYAGCKILHNILLQFYSIFKKTFCEKIVVNDNFCRNVIPHNCYCQVKSTKKVIPQRIFPPFTDALPKKT